ncbi:hypothetical protein Tco_1301729 [Tanacetum coccineum]
MTRTFVLIVTYCDTDEEIEMLYVNLYFLQKQQGTIKVLIFARSSDETVTHGLVLMIKENLETRQKVENLKGFLFWHQLLRQLHHESLIGLQNVFASCHSLYVVLLSFEYTELRNLQTVALEYTSESSLIIIPHKSRSVGFPTFSLESVIFSLLQSLRGKTLHLTLRICGELISVRSVLCCVCDGDGSGGGGISSCDPAIELLCMVRGNRLGMRKQARRLAREARRLVRKARWLARVPNQSLASYRRPRGSSWLVDRECSSCHLAGPRIGYPEALIANHLWRLVGKKTEIPLNCWALNCHQLSFVKGLDLVECDMHVNTPLPITDVRKEYFDINSPLGEQVVDFLMENVDVAGLPRHLVKKLFSHLIKNPSLTRRTSDEPLGDDLKPISYNVTFSNSLFNFNDDYTLCNDNLLFDEEFEDINAIVDIDLLLGEHLDTLSTKDREIDFNPSKDIEELECLLADDPVPTSDLFEELITEIGLDDSIPIGIDDRYYDSEVGWEDEGDKDPFFWFSSYAITPSCCILTKGGDVSLLPSAPHIGVMDLTLKVKIPSDESKVHIEVLSVLWGNRLPIPDGSLPLSRMPDVSVFKKDEGIPEVEIRQLALSVRTPDVSVV